MRRSSPTGASLRILHLAFDEPRRPGSGGSAVRNHEINRRLARHHHVTAVTVSYPGARARVEDGVHYLPVGLPLGYYGAVLTYFAMLPLVVWTHRYDLLVEDFAAPFGSALVPLWARGTVIAQVQWLSAQEKSRQYHLPFFLSERFGARHHRLLIAVSARESARLRAMNSDAEVVVVPNGLEQGVWSACEGDRRDILFLGPLEIAGKGLDMLLPAFAAVAPYTDANLVIAGDAPDRNALSGLVHRHGLNHRVWQVGRVEGAARFDLLASARILCLPTRDESCGLVALEALACGTPVIAFDIQALRDLLRPETSVLVPAFDVDAYSRALGRLLADPERCRRMGADGRRWARGFDWDRIAHVQEEVYVRAVSERRAPREGAGPGAALAARVAPDPPARTERTQAASVTSRPPGRMVPPSGWRTGVSALPSARVQSIGRVATLVGVGLGTFAVRALLVQHAFEIQVDEGIYLHISQNLARLVGLVYGDHPFFLHPPLFFVIEAGYLKLFSPSGDPVQQVIAVRYLAAFFGGLSGVVLFALCRRLAGSRAAAAAAAMFALDPFIVRMDSRNLLEASAVFWILLGLYAIVPLCGRDGSRPHPRWSVPVASLSFAAALLTNEPSAFVTLLPLTVCALTGVVAVRKAATIAGWALTLYSIYPLTVVLTGNTGQFQDQKLGGLRRFSGLTVVTGYNGKSGPSFLQAVISNLHWFAPTYALLAAGLLATAWLVSRQASYERLGSFWAGSAYAMQAYSVLFGTNEEQYFYYVSVMAILAVVIATRSVLRSADTSGATAARGERAPPRLRHPALLALPVVLLLPYVGLSAYLAVNRYSTPDDGYRRMASYLEANAPSGTPVACTGPTEAVLLGEDGYTVTDMTLVTEEGQRPVRVHDPRVLLAGHPRYVIVTSKLVDQNYGVATPEVVQWLERNTELVLTFQGPSDGTLKVFRVRGETP